MKFAALLVAIALIPVAFCAGYLFGEPSKADIDWIYGPKTTFPTNEKGVIVYCQEKTNSVMFSKHIKAAAGDIDMLTCRAVKGEFVPPKPEPKS